MRFGLVALIVASLCAFGCGSKSPEETAAANEPTPPTTAPRQTAAEASKAIENNPNIPPEFKARVNLGAGAMGTSK